jgi:hypothetical protein
MFDELITDTLANLTGNLDAKKMRKLLSQMEVKRLRTRANNVKIFKKILKFFKIQNSLYTLFFGFSKKDYQTKVLDLVYKFGIWILKKCDETTAYPILSFDKQLSEILKEFNHVQEENNHHDRELCKMLVVSKDEDDCQCRYCCSSSRRSKPSVKRLHHKHEEEQKTKSPPNDKENMKMSLLKEYDDDDV